MPRIEKILLAVLGGGLAWAFAVTLLAAAPPAGPGIEEVQAVYFVDRETDLAYMPRHVLERLIASNNAFADDLRRLHAKGCR